MVGWGWVGLEGSLKVIELQNGWVGRVLEGHRSTGWLEGLEGSLKTIELLNDFDGLGWKG